MTFDATDRARIRRVAERLRAVSADLVPIADRALTASRELRRSMLEARAAARAARCAAAATCPCAPSARSSVGPVPAAVDDATAGLPAAVCAAVLAVEVELVALGGVDRAGPSGERGGPAGGEDATAARSAAVTRAVGELSLAELRALVRDLRAVGRELGVPTPPAGVAPGAAHFRPSLRN